MKKKGVPFTSKKEKGSRGKTASCQSKRKGEKPSFHNQETPFKGKATFIRWKETVNFIQTSERKIVSCEEVSFYDDMA